MKVVQINTVCGYGSTGKIAASLADLMTTESIENKIVYGYLDAPIGYDTYKISSKLDRYIHLFETYVFDRHCFSSYWTTIKLINKIKEYKPDIVHIHNLHGYYINMEILFKYLASADVKVIWTLHDCWGFTGHCTHFDYIGCNKWKTQCHSCPQKREYPISFFRDNSKNNYIKKRELSENIIDKLTVVTPSVWLSGLVKESFLKKADCRVINNGIMLDAFKKSSYNVFQENKKIRNKHIILGVANVWTTKKGVEYFNKLSDLLNSEKYQIILVGVTKQDKNKFQDNIITLERTSSIKELAEIYSSADLLLNPTLEDNFPTVNLEAQACGTPVITFKTGGSPESIVENTGIVIERDNITELKNAIEYMCENKNMYDSQSCINNSKQYDYNVKLREYIDLYKELYNEKTRLH